MIEKPKPNEWFSEERIKGAIAREEVYKEYNKEHPIEPKPDGVTYTLSCAECGARKSHDEILADIDRGMGKIISKKSKPDRLLIPEELAVVFKKVNSMNALDYAKPIMEAQDTKTASKKDAEIAKKCTAAFSTGRDMAKAECQERVERIKREIEAIVSWGKYEQLPSGKQIRDGHIMSEPWQALWGKEGVK